MEACRQIVENFQRNEVEDYGNLPRETRHLISFAVLTALGSTGTMPDEVAGALQDEVAPVAIREAILQCTPYVGYPRTMDALATAEQAMREQGVTFPLLDCATVTADTRMAQGCAAQYAIFGKEAIEHNRESAPPELRHIQDYLSDYCFGDFYTRRGIDLPTRELLTFCILCALGGCEPQLKAHIGGNLQVGNDRQTLLSAVTWCVPYIGFPRTLNAIACINAVTQTQA